MKKLNISFLTLLVAALFFGCEEKERAFIEYDDLEHGAYARIIDGVNGIYDFFDPDGSCVDFEVEFYDDNQGRNVASYDWTVSYVNNVDGTVSAPADIASVDASQFGTSDFGLPSTALQFCLGSSLAALGLTTDDINGGDVLRYEATITLNDGRQFTAANTGSNVISSAPFSAFFRFDQAILCPSMLEGTFDVVTTDPWCGSTETFTGTTTWEQVAPGVYEVVSSSLPDGEPDETYGAYDLCYTSYSVPMGTLQIQDACGILTPLGADQWGDSYIYESVSTDGPTLTIVWVNTYGEGGTVMLTRQDGMDWPPLTN